MFLDQIDEAVHRFGFGNIEFDRLFANVKIDLAGRTADITEIRIRHFAGSIHDATHDRDLHAFQVRRARLDPRRHRLQIKQRPAT